MTDIHMSPAPLELEVVLSPEWLTSALGEKYPGAEVSSTTITETLRTVATKVRFHVEYVNGASGGAPSDMCVKGYFEPHTRSVAGGEREPRFYEELAPSLGIRVPPWVYSGIDPENHHPIVIMDDLVATGSTFLGALSPYGVDQARASLEQIARLNASDWGGARFGDTPWLAPRIATIATAVPVERIEQLLTDPRKDRVPAELLDAHRILASLQALVERSDDWPRALVHGDLHAGNIYLDPQGRPGLIDWQLLQCGPWMLDFAYHVVAVLTIEEREQHEVALLHHHLDMLQAHGAEPPPFEEAWQQYELACAYGYFLWSITQFVDPPIIYEFFGRLGAAVAAHDTFAKLGV